MASSSQWREQVKLRFRLSDEAVKNGLPADPYVLKIREARSVQNKRIKEKVKLKIAASNESVKNGGEADPWVIEYRKKNNKIKAAWKSTKPKSTYKPKANSGSFKKGMIPLRKLTDEQKEISKEKDRQRSRQWRIDNKERLNEQLRLKRKNDPEFKIKCNLRKRLSFLVRLYSLKKSKQTLALLGCDMPFFMKHIESLFQDGMTWSNYGFNGWHLDHKIPCDAFDLSKPEEQGKCFHYTNIQPLWGVDNLRKNKKLDYKPTCIKKSPA